MLRIVRTIDAPRETVFRAWTEVELFRQWFGPVAGSTPSVEFDAREGGAFRVAMKVPGTPVVFAMGTFREINPPERLVFDFGWERVPGHPADTRRGRHRPGPSAPRRPTLRSGGTVRADGSSTGMPSGSLPGNIGR